MSKEIHEDQPLVEPSGGMSTALQEAVGTTGTVSAGVAWALIPEMTMTLALNAGDLILMMLTINLYVVALNYGEVRFTVNGIQQGFNYRMGNQSAASNQNYRSVYSMMQMYTAPAAGNYTIQAEWMRPAGATLRCVGNERTITVGRFY